MTYLLSSVFHIPHPKPSINGLVHVFLLLRLTSCLCIAWITTCPWPHLSRTFLDLLFAISVLVKKHFPQQSPSLSLDFFWFFSVCSFVDLALWFGLLPRRRIHFMFSFLKLHSRKCILLVGKLDKLYVRLFFFSPYRYSIMVGGCKLLHSTGVWKQ